MPPRQTMAATTAVPSISTVLETSHVVSTTDGFHDVTMVTYDASAPTGVVYVHFVQGTRGLLPADGSYTPAPWAPSTSYLSNQFVANAGAYYHALTPGRSGGTGPTGSSQCQDGGVLWGCSLTPPSLFHIPIPIRHTNGVEDVVALQDAVTRGKFLGGLIVLISTAKLTKVTPSAPYAMFDVMAS
jgi:hypothetical protein